MKHQENLTTTGSIITAIYYSLIDFIETKILEDYADEEDIMVERSIVNDASRLAERIKNGETVDVKVYAPGSATEESEYEIGSGLIVIRVDRSSPIDSYSYLDLFSLATRVPFIHDSHIIKSYASNTARTRIEYIMLYSTQGDLYMFEGEYDRVSLPFVRVALSIHTHPSLPGSCALSKADVASGLDLLSVGGIGEAAATTYCAFIMYRRGLIDEDTYVNIKSSLGTVTKPGTIGRVRFEVISF